MCLHMVVMAQTGVKGYHVVPPLLCYLCPDKWISPHPENECYSTQQGLWFPSFAYRTSRVSCCASKLGVRCCLLYSTEMVSLTHESNYANTGIDPILYSIHSARHQGRTGRTGLVEIGYRQVEGIWIANFAGQHISSTLRCSIRKVAKR